MAGDGEERKETADAPGNESMLFRVCCLMIFAAAGAEAEVSFSDLRGHPRLFADQKRFDELKKMGTDGGSGRDFHEVIVKRADALLKQEPVVRRMVGKRLLGASRQALECITVSSMAWKLEGKPEYKARAIAEMRALAGFTDWNRPHFLDVAEATFAMGVGYDWLHADLSPEDRDLFATAIVEKGLKQSLPNAAGKEHTWVQGRNNWNQVCHGGMVIGALAVADREPELSKGIVDRAVENLKYSASAYAPDGVYPEGPGYWEYGTSFHVALIEALRTSLGDSFGLEKFPGFLKTADYEVQMETPSGRFYNFGDNAQTRGFLTPLFWFAKELGRPELIRRDLSELEKLRSKSGELERLMPLALIWWDAASRDGQATPPVSWFGDGKVPVAVFRQKWNDEASVFVGAKGGKPDVSHGHMDVGSFIVEAAGVRWAEDPGLQSYNTLESKGIDLWQYGQDSERWKVFRLGPEAHNIPRFDGSMQEVEAAAVVVKSDVPKQFVIFDLGKLYAPSVAGMTRGIRLMPSGEVVIRDEWKARDKPVGVSFQWLTKADVDVSEEGVALRQKGKSFYLSTASGTPVKIEVDDLSKPVNDYDEPNPGLKRIRFVMNTKAGESGALTVRGSVLKDGGVVKTTLAEW